MWICLFLYIFSLVAPYKSRCYPSWLRSCALQILQTSSSSTYFVWKHHTEKNTASVTEPGRMHCAPQLKWRLIQGPFIVTVLLILFVFGHLNHISASHCVRYARESPRWIQSMMSMSMLKQTVLCNTLLCDIQVLLFFVWLHQAEIQLLWNGMELAKSVCIYEFSVFSFFWCTSFFISIQLKVSWLNVSVTDLPAHISPAEQIKSKSGCSKDKSCAQLS